jgi:broad specificity phosphatase PhoE
MTLDSPSEIWLVRHGQSESNANFTTSAPHSSRLTERGWHEAHLFAQFLDRRPDLLIVSPYVRAIESARPLREKYPDTPMAQWPIEEFTYLPPLAYQGTTAVQRRPLIEAYWQKSDPDFRHPGAESFTNFLVRVNAALERMKKLRGFTVIISHGHVMRLLWQILAVGLAPSAERQMQAYNHLRQAVVIPNCAVLRLHCLSGTETVMSGFIDVIGMHPRLPDPGQ